MRVFRLRGDDSPFCWQSCLILLLGLLILTSDLAAPSAAFAQAPPLPTVFDSNFEAVEFFTVSPVSSANFGGSTNVAAAPGTGAFGTDVFLAEPGAFSDTLDGRIFRLSDLNGDGDALDAGESTLAINNTLRSPLSMDFGFGGDLFIMDYPQSSSLRFIYKLTNSATPVLSQHTTNGIFNHNTIQFLPLDGGGEQLIINASQNFTIFGGTNDGRLFRTGSTSGQPSVEWSNGTNITEGVPAGWWDPNFQSGVFPGNWLLVRNGAFKDSSGTIHGSGSLWAVKDVNNDGDANDPGEARVMIPDPNVPIGAIRFDSNGVGYGFGGVNVWRFEDVNNDGDFWDFGAGAFDAGENVVFITGTISFQSIDLGPNGEIYLTAASGTSPNFTSHTYLVRPTFPTTPPVVSSLCGPSNPAAISGSTGEQGMLDPTNTNASLGLVWPANAIGAGIALDTGAVDFIDSTGAELPNTATLPGVSGYPAFPDGKLNFTSVHLPPGKVVLIFCCDNELLPSLEIAPAMILSCQDVIVEGNGDGTLANNGGILAVVGRFDGGGRGNPPVSNPAGFGPRSVPRPATGTLFPAVPAGGGRGGTGIPVGQTVSQTLRGGDGGGAAVIAAAGRITVNGLVSVNPNILWTLPNLPDPGETPPLNAQAASSSSTVAQGGAGGSVRFAAVLVEGIGKIDTSGGLDSDGGKTSLDGPIEIQAFLQDLFTGTASTTPIRGNPVVAPIPDNLPTIQVVGVTVSGSDFCGFECPNTGSLSTPDVTLPPTSSPVTVFVEASTTGVPNGTSLTFRAVGTNGAASTATVAVGGPECPIPGPSIACTNLTLQPGAVYQMVVYPSTAFALANLGTPPTPMSNKPVYAGLQIVPNEQKTEARSQKLEVRSQTKVAAKPVAEKPLGTRDLSPLEQWARAFGVDPEAHQKMAQLKTAP